MKSAASVVAGIMVPKAVIRDFPIFIQIDFIRAKKVVYLILIVSRGNGTSNSEADRLFGLSYRDMHGTVITYGNSKAYAEVCLYKLYQLSCSICLPTFLSASSICPSILYYYTLIYYIGLTCF